MVSERRNFQRIYDLTERVLPPELDTTSPTPDGLGRFEARRALGNLGFAPQDNVKWGRRGKKAIPEEVLRRLVDTGEVTPFEIEGIEDQGFCALTDALEAVMGSHARHRTVHVLSPFDNLIINRGWLERYFDFAYKFEAYTPKAKRIYGYFTLPILWGEQVVARMDSKADRKPKTFVIRNLLFEPSFDQAEAFFPALADKLRAFATFNGCERFAIEQLAPAKFRAPLEAELAERLER
jgi:uncharacterized protein YcaQ